MANLIRGAGQEILSVFKKPDNQCCPGTGDAAGQAKVMMQPAQIY
jgi:hypothetical protein